MDVDTREGPRIGDASGAILLACAEAGRVWGIVERDDGYLDSADAARYFLPYGQWDRLDR